MTNRTALPTLFLVVPASVALVFGACDFEQLHNPNQTAGSATGGAGGAPTTGAAGSATGGAGDATGGSGGAAGENSTSGPSTTGSAGSGGGGTGGGGGGPGGSGGAMTDASAGGSGGSGTVDATAETAPCTAGYALQFNGTSGFATLARSVQDDFTLEAWIKPSATLPVLTGTNIWNGYGIIYADTTSTTNDFGTSIVNGKFAFGVGNPDTNVQSAGSIANGQWTHVAATRAKATGVIQVFVNGTMDGTKTTTNLGSLTAPTLITIGADTIDSHYFAGLIDEVRLWNVARMPTEIAATMHQRLTGNEAGLVGYYRFDDATGTTAVDASPTHGNATLSGGDAAAAPTWVMSDAPVCP
jgi:hypothetical protein